MAACSVYGGPGVQRVRDVYNTTRNPRPQRFRDMGFLVFQVDNRGSSRRGVAFEAPLKHKMGTVEVDDQVRLQRCGDATRVCFACSSLRLVTGGWSALPSGQGAC